MKGWLAVLLAWLVTAPALGHVAVVYSDGSAVTYTNHSRLGLPRELADASGGRTLYYDHAGRLVSERWTGGLLSGLTVSNRLDRVYGRDRLTVTPPSGSALTWDYGFDDYGRPETVTRGSATFSYGYLPNADLLQTTTGSYGTTVLTATRSWECGYRLRGIQNVVGGTSVSGHAYAYDPLDRRIRATLPDNSAWVYDYDDRNEVVGGKRFWADQTPVAGQQFEYAFDPIGNRISTKVGGDANGANLRSSSWTNNAANQLTGRGVSAAIDVLGAAIAPATVSVNGYAASEKGEYFRGWLSVRL